MLKYVLMASAVTIAVPAVAQDTTAGQKADASISHKAHKAAKSASADVAAAANVASTATPPAATEPVTPAPADPTAATDPAQTTAPVQTTATPATAPTAVAATPQDATTPAATPAGSDQVASIVDSEFPTYDKDGSGSLNKAEFAAWMNALKAKAAADGAPAAKPDVKWNEAAFKQADADQSKSVSKEELAGFLNSGGKSGA